VKYDTGPQTGIDLGNGKWKSEGRRTLKRLMHRWEDNIRMDLREIGYEDELEAPGSG
jgi:hypothetical protein